MTAPSEAPPDGSREILHQALRQRLHRSRHLPSLRGSPQIGAPLPIYLLRAASLSPPVRLSQAKPIGWRYPILGGGAPGLATLLKERGSAKYAGLSHGPLARRIVEAASLIATKTPSLESYSLRLLEIPALRTYALWLFAPRQASWFVSLLDGRPPGTAELRLERSIRRRIVSAWEASRKARESARLPKTTEQQEGLALIAPSKGIAR